MSLMGCVNARPPETVLQDIEEAVKENAVTRLQALLHTVTLGPDILDKKCLLHQAAWLGFPKCVRMLIANGANPDTPHRKNGCTPLHLAHFCTIEDTNPALTIQSLVEAGASVNNPGDSKCGRLAIEHAIQHQRLDAVHELIAAGSVINVQAVTIAIDVASPRILEVLLKAGAQCGKFLQTTLFWGKPLHRILYAPLKSPKECYKRLLVLTVQATMFNPFSVHPSDDEDEEKYSLELKPSVHLMIETELKLVARDYADFAVYIYAFLLRNGYRPSLSVRGYFATLGAIEWEADYLSNPVSLKDLTMRVVRARLYMSGNILYGLEKLDLPSRLKDWIKIPNPF